MPPSGTTGGDRPAVPPIPEAVVKYLERTFPDRLPADEMEPVRSLRFRSGQVHVVRHLRAVYERQTRNILAPESMK